MMFYALIILVFVLNYINQLLESVFPNFEENKKKKSDIVKQKGDSQNFYLEVRIDVLADLYHEILLEINRRHNSSFPTSSLEKTD